MSVLQQVRSMYGKPQYAIFVSRLERRSGTLYPICKGKAHETIFHMGCITRIKK